MSEEGKVRLEATLREVWDAMTAPAPTYGYSIVAVTHDGRPPVDLTEAVLALYDLCLESPYWGSGMVTADEALPVLMLARTLNLPNLPEVEEYVAEYERKEAAFAERRANIRKITEWRASHTADEPLPSEVARSVEALGGVIVDEAEGIERALADMPEHLRPTPTPKSLVPSEALAVLAPDEDRPVTAHYDAPPVKEQVRQGPPLPIATPSVYLQE